MILRRIYMLVPSRHQAKQVVRDLMMSRVNRQHIHALAKPGINIEGLPEATVRQRSGFAAKIESWFWDFNLMLFFAAFVVLLFSFWASEWVLMLAGLMVMVATVVLGYYFAGQVHQAHIEDFDVPLGHGEILLLVDVPHWRVSEVERSIRELHPEAELGGVGWGLDAFGI